MSFNLNIKYLSYHSAICIAILSCLLYGYIGYFTSRSDFYTLIIISGLLFISAFLLIEKSRLSFHHLLGLAILYRLLLLCCTPNLSQDFFRFFWDGQLIINGYNPYLYTVNDFFDIGNHSILNHAEVSRQGMGELSAGHYSNYPPFSQFIYSISAFFAQNSILGFIISLRCILIGFDLLFIVFSKKLLLYFNMSPRRVFWYILNPLCLLELTLNLHLEGVMIALFIVSLYLLLRHKHILCAMLLSVSITTKLLSVLVIPLLIKFQLNKNCTWPSFFKSSLFSIAILSFTAFQFFWFYDSSFLTNFSNTIGLWFGTFEFNASIFYLARWIGYEVYGWNIIGMYSSIMPFIFLFVFVMIFIKMKRNLKSLILSFMWILASYFLHSTTIHPWYLLFPVALSIYSKYRFIYLWSFLIILSYFAYSHLGQVKESLILISVEYIVVLVAMIYEIAKYKTTTKSVL